MGPCELMDLIGHDVNFAVTESMFVASFFDKRYVPSVVQRDLVDGGFLGKKSGRGFYDYRDVQPAHGAGSVASTAHKSEPGCVSAIGDSTTICSLSSALSLAGWQVEHASADPGEAANGAHLPVTDYFVVSDTLVCVSDGRPASQLAAELGRQHLAVIDLILNQTPGSVCVAFSPACGEQQRTLVHNMLQAAGRMPVEMGDAPGLVVARTVAMIVNEAAEAVLQEACDEVSANTAMKLGTNYPGGPFDWLGLLGPTTICMMLDHLHSLYRGERYRASLLLRMRTWAHVAEVN